MESNIFVSDYCINKYCTECTSQLCLHSCHNLTRSAVAEYRAKELLDIALAKLSLCSTTSQEKGAS